MIPVAIIMSVLSIALALNSFRLCAKVEKAEEKARKAEDARDRLVTHGDGLLGQIKDAYDKARKFEDALAEAVGQLEAEKKRADLAERNRRGAHDSTSKVAAKFEAAEKDATHWLNACAEISRVIDKAYEGLVAGPIPPTGPPSGFASRVVDHRMPRTEVEPNVVGQVAHDRMRGETR